MKIAALLAALPPAGAVTYSGIKMAECAEGDELQRWEVEELDGKPGRIRDSLTGRCLAVETCAVTAGAAQWKPVRLDECGAAPATGGAACDGKNEQWIAVPSTAGGLMFKSALTVCARPCFLGPALRLTLVLEQAAGTCYCLNIPGDLSLGGHSVVAYGDPTCDPNANNNHFLDAAKGQLEATTGTGGCKRCCVTADPCVAPCSLPLGWGWSFIIVFGCSSVLYLFGGLWWAVKVQGKMPTHNVSFMLGEHPHAAYWQGFHGCVHDGIVYAVRRQASWRAGKGYEEVPAVPKAEAAAASPAPAPAPAPAGAAGSDSEEEDEIVE